MKSKNNTNFKCSLRKTGRLHHQLEWNGVISVIWMIVNLHFNWLPENALNRHIKSGCQIRKYILCYSSDREVERRSTVYKKIHLNI